jgi:hypothetical protein
MDSFAKSLGTKDLQYSCYFAERKVYRNDTPLWDTCVVKTQP